MTGGDADLAWTEGVPGPLTSAVLREFLPEFQKLSTTLVSEQARLVADPAGLPELEWALEQRMIALVGRCFGTATILAEESFTRYGRVTGSGDRLRVVIDPLDGSASYLRNSERFTATLAVYVDGRPVLALIHQPTRDALYSALAGQGCWLNGRPLRPRPNLDRTVVVKKQWIAREPALGGVVRRLAARGYQLERMESTSLKLCWVAEGRRAGLVKWLSRTNDVVLEWGTTAGMILCAEVGLTGRRLDGTPWNGEGGGLLVGDPRCLADMFPTTP